MTLGPATGYDLRRMQQTRATSTAKRRREILEAGLECFTQKGVAATTMEDIRAASGASIGSIYHHFENKEGLAAALYIEGIREYQEGLLREVRRHDSAEQAVKTLVIYHLRWFRNRSNWARFLLHRKEYDFMEPREPELREMNRQLSAELSAMLARFATAGDIVSLPPDMILPLLLGPVQSFGRIWLAGRARTTIREAERILATAAWRSLRLEGDRRGQEWT